MARIDYDSAFSHQALVRVIEAFFSDDFAARAADIPAQAAQQARPDIKLSVEQLIAAEKDRCLAALGCLVENDNSSVPETAAGLTTNRLPQSPVLSISKSACNRCPSGTYFVTPACQGCLARPCTNCPFGAIEFVDGKSHINQEKCKKCGICAKSCPYGAILQQVRPCEAACPVKAVEKDSDGAAKINHDKCVSCGKCAVACPFGAVMTRSQIIDVLTAIKLGKHVVAMPAPAIMAQFGAARVGQVLAAFKKAGFTEAIEVAVGADVTTWNESAELAERMEQGAPFMTTSCCPAWMRVVKKHVPELAEYVSHTRSPMHYTAEIVKKQNPDAITVFIGPCMAKREEGIADEYTDYVLNNKEIEALFDVLGIKPVDCEDTDYVDASKQSRAYALSGGVAQAVIAQEKCAVCPIAINGVSKETIAQLKLYAKNKKADGNLIEVMVCPVGCIAGPGVSVPTKQSTKDLKVIMDASVDQEKR